MTLNPKNLGNGQEQYEFFSAMGKPRVQYDYRDCEGELFSCVAKSLDEARARRDAWVTEKPVVWHLT